MKCCSLFNRSFLFQRLATTPRFLTSLCPFYSFNRLSSLLVLLLFFFCQHTQSHHKLDRRQLNELSEDSLTAITRCVGIRVETECPVLLISRQMSHFLSSEFRWEAGEGSVKRFQVKEAKAIKQEKNGENGRQVVLEGRKKMKREEGE